MTSENADGDRPSTPPSQDGSEERWRLFIAIPLPEAVKVEMEKVQAELRRALPEGAVRWTRRDQFHLTLRFLGNVEAQRADALTTNLRGACAGFSPIHLRAERIGFFPSMRRPQVIWAWVHDAQEQLVVVQRAIETAVADFTGEPSEKTFTGHVTLGRSKAVKRPEAELLAKLASSMTNRFFGEWTADHVEIIRSELASGGSRYTTLSAVRLGA